jgi:putative hemolysin
MPLPQRTAPTSQVAGQAAQAPPTQAWPAPHVWVVRHSPQPAVLGSHVSTVPPLQRCAPTVHGLLQAPQRPLLQAPLQVADWAQAVQPCASASHVSMALPLQRVMPAVQASLHAAQRPLSHEVPSAQLDVTHAVQPVVALRVQISVAFSTQRRAPSVQASHDPQDPAEQVSPCAQASGEPQVVQPLAPTTQACAMPAWQRFAPAVHWLVHAVQLPPWQVDCAGQGLTVQVVQPMEASTVQVCKLPSGVHCEAPAVQASLQQVAALKPMALSAVASPAWLLAT